MNERSIFLAALEIEDSAERAAFLDEACRGETALRRRLDALLAAHSGTTGFMENPAAASTFEMPTGTSVSGPTSSDPVPGATGALLADRYLVGEEIGRGGMGTVYRAEQIRPFKRSVAIKLVNPGMDSRMVLARFEAERQALAVMDHPHIAKVLDAGATPDGRPFFVMELVKGVPLTEYCDARQLPIAIRLELLRQVCGAVQHAHQKGVIHRDLKPSNILVEDHVGVPAPKVIDFGLAKAIGGTTLTEQTLDSVPGSVAGTPLYMAPEQAGPDSRDVDTRADVYALGAILYELLTGSPPIGRETLRRAALHEVLRVIREQEPQPPSSRLGSSADLTTVAVNRGIEPARLGRFVRGDLDWVAMKALEKDRGRRYDTAAALGEDLDRFLNHEPVAAGPPTVAYRVRKFLRRNRATAIAAGLVLLALVVGVIGTTWGLLRAETQREKAELATKKESKANGELRVANEQVQARFDLAQEAIRSFSQAVKQDEVLKQDNLRPLRDKLLRSAAGFYGKLGELLESRPDLPSRQALGNAYFELGDLTRTIGDQGAALEIHQKGLLITRKLADEAGPSATDYQREVGTVLNQIGVLLGDTGDLRKAMTVLGEALEIRRRLAESNPDRPDIQADLATTHNDIGYLLGLTGDTAGAIESHRRSNEILVALPRAHPDEMRFQFNLARGLYNVGTLLLRKGDTAGALESIRRSNAILVALSRAHPEDPEVQATLARNHGQISQVLRTTGDLAGALESVRRSIAILGPLSEAHPAVTEYLSNLAGVHDDMSYLLYFTGEPAKAKESLAQALKIARRLAEANPTVPDYQAQVAEACNGLGRLLGLTGDAAGSLASYRESLAIRRRLSEAHPTVPDYQAALAGSHNNIGVHLLDSGDTAGALKSMGEALAIRRRLSEAHPTVPGYQANLANTQNSIGIMLTRSSDPAGALNAFREALAIRRRLSEAYPTIKDYATGLASTLIEIGLANDQLGRMAECVASLRQGIAIEQEFARDPTALFALSVHQARLAGAAAKPGSGMSVDAARAEADRAISMVARAMAAGYRKIDDFRKNKYFDSIRSRVEFRELLMDLEFPEQPFEP